MPILTRILCFAISMSAGYWASKFYGLIFTLLAAGQFFTPLLAACFSLTLTAAGLLFLFLAID